MQFLPGVYKNVSFQSESLTASFTFVGFLSCMCEEMKFEISCITKRFVTFTTSMGFYSWVCVHVLLELWSSKVWSAALITRIALLAYVIAFQVIWEVLSGDFEIYQQMRCHIDHIYGACRHCERSVCEFAIRVREYMSFHIRMAFLLCDWGNIL